jgi:steroid 5-alpha reductase family enzyme
VNEQGGDRYRVGRRWAAASRATSLGVVTLAYLLAGVAGWATIAILPHWHPVGTALCADLVATIVVFAVSMLAGNSSLYDPYWSVAPPVIAVAWVLAASNGYAVRQLLVGCLVLIWAVRLTGNWVSTWRGLGHEDWRYVRIRDATRGRPPWWLVSLTGIQLMPTLIVFVGLLPVWSAVTGGAHRLGPLDAAAVLVTTTAIGVEATADWQLRRFARDPANRGRVAEVGLWRYSRHPNYLGEIGFWCGLWLFGLAGSTPWWTVAGPLVMVALFTGVSVPLMDQRSLRRRAGYAEHMRRVPALVPRPRRGSRPPS